MTDPGLSCEFLGLNLPNPLVLASGILGTSASLLLEDRRQGDNLHQLVERHRQGRDVRLR